MHKLSWQPSWRSAWLPSMGVSIGTTENVIVANRFQIATSVTSIAANFTSRRSHYATSQADITNLHCVDVGWYLNSGAPASGGSRTIKRFIEYPANVFHQVTWSGATSKTLSAAAVDSDVILSSVTGLPLTIGAGEKFWERTVNLNSTITNFPIVVLPASSQALGIDDGNSTSDLGNSGTISPTSSTNTFGMTALVGDIGKANARSFLCYGDSIMFGEGDVTGVGSKESSGYVPRLLDNHGYPYFKMCVGGWQAAQAAANTASPIALLDNIPFTDFLCQLGVNDLRVGRTKAQIEADYQTIYGLSGSAGLSPARIWQATITPRTTTTDSYATVENQTPKTDGNMADLTPLNTDIRSGLPNVTNILEAADAAMSVRDSNVWSGPFPPVLDGTHPTTAKAAAMASVLSV